jgi:hypothetical protein
MLKFKFFPSSKNLIVTLFFCLVSKFICAQEAFTQVHLHASLALPFDDNIAADSSLGNDLLACGFGFGVMVPLPKKSPIKVGGGFRYMWMGEKTKDFYLIDNEGIGYYLESKVKGSMSPLHAMLRIDPRSYTNFPIIPYFGGFAGARFFETKHTLTFDYEDRLESIKDHDTKLSVTSSYGFEIGLHVQVAPSVLIDLRYEHAYGGSAKYLDLSTIEINENGEASYARLETRTNVSMFTIGIAVNIE